MSHKQIYALVGISVVFLAAIITGYAVLTKTKPLKQQAALNVHLPEHTTPSMVPSSEASALVSKKKPDKLDPGLELKGTVVATGIDSHAIILIRDENREILVKTGDMIKAFIVKTIGDETVLLEKDGRQHRLKIVSSTSGGEGSETPGEPFEHSVQISWDDLDQLGHNLLPIGSHISIRTHFKEGGVKGLQVASLKKETWLSLKLGLEEGDVVTAINGNAIQSKKEIPNPYDLLEQIQSSGNMQIDIYRNGAEGRLNVSIK